MPEINISPICSFFPSARADSCLTLKDPPPHLSRFVVKWRGWFYHGLNILWNYEYLVLASIAWIGWHQKIGLFLWLCFQNFLLESIFLAIQELFLPLFFIWGLYQSCYLVRMLTFFSFFCHPRLSGCLQAIEHDISTQNLC